MHLQQLIQQQEQPIVIQQQPIVIQQRKEQYLFHTFMNPSSWNNINNNNNNSSSLITGKQISTSEGKSVSCSPSSNSLFTNEMMASSSSLNVGSTQPQISHFTTPLTNEMLNSIQNDIHMTTTSSSSMGHLRSNNSLVSNVSNSILTPTPSLPLSQQQQQHLSVIIPSPTLSTSLHLENLNPTLSTLPTTTSSTSTPSPLTPSSTTSATSTPMNTFLKLNVEELLVDLHQEQQHHQIQQQTLGHHPHVLNPSSKLVPSCSSTTNLNSSIAFSQQVSQFHTTQQPSNQSSFTQSFMTQPPSQRVNSNMILSNNNTSFPNRIMQNLYETQNAQQPLLQDVTSSGVSNIASTMPNSLLNQVVMNASSSAGVATSTCSQMLLPKQFTIFGNSDAATSLMMSNILSSTLPNTLDDQSRKSSTTTQFVPSPLPSSGGCAPHVINSLASSSSTSSDIHQANSTSTPNAFTTFHVSNHHHESIHVTQLSSTLGEPVTELSMMFQDAPPYVSNPQKHKLTKKKKSGVAGDTTSMGEMSPTLSQSSSKKRSSIPSTLSEGGMSSRKKNKMSGQMSNMQSSLPPLKIIPSSLTSVTFHNTSSQVTSTTPTATTPSNISISSGSFMGSSSGSGGGNIQFVTNEFQEFKSGQHETQKRQRKERIYKFYSTVPSNFSTTTSTTGGASTLSMNENSSTSQQSHQTQHEERSPSFSSSSATPPRM